ncbi:MAG: hypothetical protein L3J47_11845 [Sulfurovum sp.]|nr:hypothetical protein [Sulfurovum sp.]
MNILNLVIFGGLSVFILFLFFYILKLEKNIEQKFTLIAGLEADLAKAEAELRSLRVALHDSSPKVKAARNKYYSLKRQVQKEKARSIRSNGKKSKTIGAERMAKLAEKISLLFVYNNLDMLPVYIGKYHLELQKLMTEIRSYLSRHP